MSSEVMGMQLCFCECEHLHMQQKKQKSKIEQINMTLVLKSFFVPASSPKNLLCVCVLLLKEIY